MNKPKTIAILACVCLALAPLAASAYVGPGAGLSLLGALWALIVAIAAAVVFLFAWPIRRMRRRKRDAKELEEQELKRRNVPPATEAGDPSAMHPQEAHEPRTP
jgi:membrane protein implicated in regulation of membrane protease activity